MIKPYEVIVFCNENKISVEELLFLHRIYCKQKNLKEQVSFNTVGELYHKLNKPNFDYIKLFRKLELQELVINDNVGTEMLLAKIKVTDKFIQAIFVEKSIAFREALMCYPTHMLIDGKEVPALIAKMGTEALENLYFERILKGGNKYQHNRFVELTKIYFANKRYAEQKFDYYLMNWEIFALMQEQKIKTANNTEHGNKKRR